MATKIQLRRDTGADWASANPTLAAGEFGYESDTTKFKIGDGSTAWNSLAYKTGEGIKVVADDSATITVAEAGTLYVQGGSNVTTSTDSAGVLTINATGEVTGSSTTTFTNKTFDAEGTGNALSNVDVANLKSGVLDTDLSSVSGSDDTLASAKAIKAYVDANAGGSTGDIGFSGNSMSTSSSNANLEISANGTGQVQIAGAGTFDTGIGDGLRNLLLHKDHAQTFGSKSYANLIQQDIKIDSGQSDSSSSNDRYRNIMNVNLDLNGKDSTSSSGFFSRGPSNFLSVQPTNSGTGNSILGNASANNNFVLGTTTSSGDLTISLLAANTASIEMEANTGSTVTFTDARVFNSGAEAYQGGGTENIGTLYHFKANAAEYFDSITNEYGFHTPTSMQSLIGGVTLQNGDVTTSGVTIHDNEITSNRSNDSIHIEANGSGQVELGVPFDNIRSSSRYNYGVNKAYVNSSYDGATRIKANNEGIKATLTQTTSSTSFQLEAENRTELEMAGFSLTSSNAIRGLRSKSYNTVVNNGTSSNASTIGQVNPVSSNVTLTTTNGNIIGTNVSNFRATLEGEPASGKTSTFTNSYNYWGMGPEDLGEGGTTAGTNYYGLYIDTGSVATNNYGVWINNDAYINKLGGVTLQNGDVTAGAISITDNKIKANRSNDSICIQGNGTGQVLLAANGGDYSNVSTNARYNNANIMLFQDLDHTLGTASSDRSYKNILAQDIKLTSGQNSSDSDQRWRNQALLNLDLNGSSTTAAASQYRSRGPVAFEAYATVKNNSSTNATLGQASGGNYGVSVYPGSSGNLTITNLTGMGTYFELSPSSGDLTITDAVAYESIGIDYYHGSGTSAMTSFYHFRAGAHSKTNLTLTNDYAFFTEEATAQSQFGAVRLMNQSGDPSGVADMSHIYAKDDGSSSEVYVRDEAGNVTKISPHNEAGEWEYYSVNKRTGKKVRVNMERMIKKLEQLTGETFIESE